MAKTTCCRDSFSSLKQNKSVFEALSELLLGLRQCFILFILFYFFATPLWVSCTSTAACEAARTASELIANSSLANQLRGINLRASKKNKIQTPSTAAVERRWPGGLPHLLVPVTEGVIIGLIGKQAQRWTAEPPR